MQQMCRIALLFILLRIAYRDIRNRSVSLIETGIAFLILFSISCYEGFHLMDSILALIPGLSLLAVSYFTKEQIGYGDGIVFVLMGSVLSISELFGALLLSLFLCALFSIGYLIIRKGAGKRSFPFVPFAAGAYLIGVVCIWR